MKNQMKDLIVVVTFLTITLVGCGQVLAQLGTVQENIKIIVSMK